MHTLAIRRPNFLRKLASVVLVLTLLTVFASDASAQRGRGFGGYGRGGFYGRGYGGFGYGRGFGYGPGFYNRGFYGLYGYPRPYIAPPIYTGFGYGYGGLGYGYGGLGYGGLYPY
jgi:hypothetical protein